MIAALVLLAAGDVGLDRPEVEQLSVDELLIEETRLMHPPSMSTPLVMVGLGLAVGAAGFAVLALNTRDATGMGSLGFLSQFIGVLGGITGVLGSSIMVTGMLIAPFRATERDEGALRLERVRERLALTGREPYEREEVLRAQLKILDDAKPTIGPATAFIVGGVLAIVAGVLSAAFVNTPKQLMSAGIAEVSAGTVTLGVGIWQAIAREQERDAIDKEKRALGRQ